MTEPTQPHLYTKLPRTVFMDFMKTVEEVDTTQAYIAQLDQATSTRFLQLPFNHGPAVTNEDVTDDVAVTATVGCLTENNEVLLQRVPAADVDGLPAYVAHHSSVLPYYPEQELQFLTRYLAGVETAYASYVGGRLTPEALTQVGQFFTNSVLIGFYNESDHQNFISLPAFFSLGQEALATLQATHPDQFTPWNISTAIEAVENGTIIVDNWSALMLARLANHDAAVDESSHGG